jgi:hypothetical protein
MHPASASIAPIAKTTAATIKLFIRKLLCLNFRSHFDLRFQVVTNSKDKVNRF